MKLLQRFVFILGFLALSSVSHSAVDEKKNQNPVEEASVLNFQDWKGGQVSRAKNSIVRLNNLILLKRSDRYKPTQAGDKRAVKDLEKVLAQFHQDLQIAMELEFEDYLSVLLAQFEGDPEKVKAMAKKLSSEEVAKTLIYLQGYKQKNLGKKSELINPIEKK